MRGGGAGVLVGVRVCGCGCVVCLFVCGKAQSKEKEKMVCMCMRNLCSCHMRTGRARGEFVMTFVSLLSSLDVCCVCVRSDAG